jgi:hypothetical protein
MFLLRVPGGARHRDEPYSQRYHDDDDDQDPDRGSRHANLLYRSFPPTTHAASDNRKRDSGLT